MTILAAQVDNLPPPALPDQNLLNLRASDEQVLPVVPAFRLHVTSLNGDQQVY